VDWNSDGQWDLMSGDAAGHLNVYIRDGDSLVPHEQYRLIDGSPLDVGENSFPAVFDWNGDGNKDLIVGSQDSTVLLYLNQGDDTWPMFQECEKVRVQDSLLPYRHANPCIFDLDQDGIQDLICGHYNGYVHFFRNTGDDTMPVFEAGESLRFEDGTPVRYGPDFWWHSRCSFGDWNNDGVPDFIMTTRDGTAALFKGLGQVGIEERTKAEGRRTSQTIVRGPEPAGFGGRLFDIQGRDVTGRARLSPGVYFVRRPETEDRRPRTAAPVRKVVVGR
jgi:hypothetical protein